MATTAVVTTETFWSRIRGFWSTAWSKVRSGLSWLGSIIKRGFKWTYTNKAVTWTVAKAKAAGSWTWGVARNPITWVVATVLLVPSFIWIGLAVVGWGTLFWYAHKMNTAWQESKTPQELWDRFAAVWPRDDRKVDQGGTVIGFVRPVRKADRVTEVTEPVSKTETTVTEEKFETTRVSTATETTTYDYNAVEDEDETLEDRASFLQAELDLAIADQDKDLAAEITGRFYLVQTRRGMVHSYKNGQPGAFLGKNVGTGTIMSAARARSEAEGVEFNWSRMNTGIEQEHKRLREIRKARSERV